MRILVTGDKGFVGSETVKLIKSMRRSRKTGTVASFYDLSEEQLTSEGWDPIHEVIGFDLMDGFDIRDKQQLELAVLGDTGLVSFAGPNPAGTRIYKKIDRILHLAAIARFDEADANPILTHETNVQGTINVVEVAKRYHIPLVFASTGSAYMPVSGTPPITEDFPIKGNSVYGCSKALADLYVQTHTPHIILRYAHLYGAEKRYHGLIGGFSARIEHDLEPILYGGKQSNDFTYIKDVAQANLVALEASWDKWNQVYNIGTGEELTAEDAGRSVCEVLGYKGGIDIRPQRTVDAQRFVFDISKAKAKLGYEPQFTFAEGLVDMFKGEK